MAKFLSVDSSPSSGSSDILSQLLHHFLSRPEMLQPFLLLAGLFGAMLVLRLVLATAQRRVPRGAGTNYRTEKRGSHRPIPFNGAGGGVSKEQRRMRSRAKAMAAIEAVDFQTKPIMNKAEFRQFTALEARIAQIGKGFRLMAQVSLAEILSAHSKDERQANAAFWEMNTRRVDFAVIDRAGHLALAIEYQGHAHYGNEAFARDAIKREAVRKSGADWMEIEADDTPSRSANEMERRLRRRNSPPQPWHPPACRCCAR